MYKGEALPTQQATIKVAGAIMLLGQSYKDTYSSLNDREHDPPRLLLFYVKKNLS
jgi:hypothetical protein